MKKLSRLTRQLTRKEFEDRLHSRIEKTDNSPPHPESEPCTDGEERLV
jgi:hypothetical protein